MRAFFVADLTAGGDLLAKQQYRYEQLEQLPGAADLITSFATLLWRFPEQFELTLPTRTPANTATAEEPDQPIGISARWRSSSESSGIFTLRFGSTLASVSFLACGLNREADRLTMQAFQQHLVRELHGTVNEPAFALMDLTERPLVATINFQSPADDLQRLVIALADRCFAAAYFRTQDLA